MIDTDFAATGATAPDTFKERATRFQDPHAATRQEILGIKARAAAQRAEIDGSMRRFETGIAWFAAITFLAMAARVAWAIHTGAFPG